METINRIKEYCLNVYKKSDIQEYTLDDNFNFNLKDEFMCIICLDNFNKGETITRIKCDHYYHTHCIYTWFKKKKTCPLCDEILKI